MYIGKNDSQRFHLKLIAQSIGVRFCTRCRDDKVTIDDDAVRKRCRDWPASPIGTFAALPVTDVVELAFKLNVKQGFLTARFHVLLARPAVTAVTACPWDEARRLLEFVLRVGMAQLESECQPQGTVTNFALRHLRLKLDL